MAESISYEKEPLPPDDQQDIPAIPMMSTYQPQGGGYPQQGPIPMTTFKTPTAVKKSKSRPSMSGCDMCIRYLLIVENFLLLLFGCVIIGLEIYLIIDKVTLISTIFGISQIEPSAYLIMVAGCLVFLFSFIGCFGALANSRRVLLAYCVGIFLVGAMSIIGVILAGVFRGEVNDQIRNYMTDMVRTDYGVNLEVSKNKEITDAWNRAQWKWYCCGVDNEGYAVYKSSKWYAQLSSPTETLKPLVPETCCVRDQYNIYISIEKCQTWPSGPPTIKSSERNDALVYLGCYEAGKQVVYEVSEYLIGIGVVLTAFSIAALLLALILVKNIK